MRYCTPPVTTRLSISHHYLYIQSNVPLSPYLQLPHCQEYSGLLDVFKVPHNDSLESRYYGPYDRLLNYALTEDSFSLFLAPQIVPGKNFQRESADTMVSLVAFNQERKAVLIVEIRGDVWADAADNRREADAQMRQRFDQMLCKAAPPRLYGLSLLGTSLCVYRGDKATGRITPALVRRPDDNRILPDDFLEGQWGLDILSSEDSRSGCVYQGGSR